MIIHLVRQQTPAPTRNHATDAGLDLRADLSEPLTLAPGEHRLITTGSKTLLPPGTVGLVCPRSGLAAKHGITVLNAPGIIDADYTGEIGVVLINLGTEAFVVAPGNRIAQLLTVPIQIESIDLVDAESYDHHAHVAETSRGTAGFGSSGR